MNKSNKQDIKKQNKAKKKSKRSANINQTRSLIKAAGASLNLGKSGTKALKQARNHKYYNVLMNPFSQDKCGIPNSARYGKTYTFQRMAILTFQPNANGDMFLQWKPRAVDRTAIVDRSPLLVDNSATYNPQTGNTVLIAPQFIASTTGWNATDVKSVSLVSAGLRIYFENPATTLQPKGRIFCAKEVEVATPYTTTNVPQNSHTLSFVTSNKEHRDFKNSNNTQIEFVYVPSSSVHLGMVASDQAISEAERWTYDPSDEFTAIFTRFDPATQIFVELYYTYEAVVVAGGAFRDLPEWNKCVGLDLRSLAALRMTGLQIRQEPISSNHAGIDKSVQSVVNASIKNGTLEIQKLAEKYMNNNLY